MKKQNNNNNDNNKNIMQQQKVFSVDNFFIENSESLGNPCFLCLVSIFFINEFVCLTHKFLK